ncbi:unnamed protein product [Linum trigynum]|uniref:Uncharacterized protein n=1 Tax=Linum trigynum TaxID=586398 RepID=A0AAV2EYL5_9ROSI
MFQDTTPPRKKATAAAPSRHTNLHHPSVIGENFIAAAAVQSNSVAVPNPSQPLVFFIFSINFASSRCNVSPARLSPHSPSPWKVVSLTIQTRRLSFRFTIDEELPTRLIIIKK